MSKKQIRNYAIMLLVTVVMGIILALYLNTTGAVPTTDGSGGYADGVYSASAEGFSSDVTVTVTVANGAVSLVEIDASGETPALGGAAAEELAATLTETGSTAGVDGVSGATYTSSAVLTAMDAALASANGGAGGYADGVYTASAEGFSSDVTVTVTVANGAVSLVEIDASGETPALGGAAAEELAATLTETGSTAGVDGVSGATYTSSAVLTAMDAALADAAA